MENTDEKTQENIRYHWNDDEFDVIRRAFKNYVVSNNDFDDEYLKTVGRLLGVTTDNSDDGWDVWWELQDSNYIQYIRLK